MFTKKFNTMVTAGVPEFMSNMPVIGDLVKGICKRAVQRVLEDVGAITAELNRGTLLRDVLPDACIPGMETNGTRPRLCPENSAL